jgi:hypothetical protein
MLSTFMRTAVAVGILALATAARADDSYYRVRFDDLKITEGELPKPSTEYDWRLWQRREALQPYASLDGKGEIYVGPSNYSGRRSPFSSTGEPVETSENNSNAILVCTPQTGDVTGRLYLPKADASGMAVVKFTIPADAAKAELKKAFYQAKEDYYRGLMQRDLPGAAWFRHELRQAQTAQNKTPEELNRNRPGVGPWRGGNRFGDVNDTYDLFSGGRAVSENLQLDRVLQGTKAEEPTVDIDTISGITIQEIDWKPLIKDMKPALDPLAASVPADQHVIFFPTFAAAVATADQAEIQGTPILHLAEPRSEDARTADRYQRQLCLSLTGLGRLLGPKVVKSVALTGSDPYFRTGTDVAVLFEAEDPELLENLLMAQIAMASSKTPGIKAEQGNIEGLAYRGVRSPDRSVCSYVAKLDHAVIVTNSLYQLERLASVAKNKSPSVASLPEYTFFRDRYRLGDAEETAFLFLSDATIRRWCSPKWRIATSRQTRDMAVLTELQAANLDRLVKKTAQPGPIYTDFATAEIGDLSLEASGVRSSLQGSLEFMTPIGELPIRKVTQAEADAYKRWRDGYQRNWSWAFDPIALRLTLKENRLAADLTVMPLILNTQYRELAAISEGAKIAPDAGDPHDALVHFILAINTKSSMFGMANNIIATASHGVTLGWLGSSVAVFVDDDPVWAELAKVPSDKLQKTFPEYIGRLPIAIRAEVSNGLRLTAFLAATRAYIEQTSPGMTVWESLTYKDQPYVKVVPTERAKGQTKELENIAVYYVASGDALLVTLNENVMKRAIDRQLAREANKKDKSAPVVAAKPWLGSNVGIQLDRRAVDIFSGVNRDEQQYAMQARAWSNLPILNEWKRLYPDSDPVKVHEQVWKIRLICPGGGSYVWNDKYQTMESTVYGHPGEPKVGPIVASAMSEFSTGNFGLTFEQKGLRARVSLEKKAAADHEKPKETATSSFGLPNDFSGQINDKVREKLPAALRNAWYVETLKDITPEGLAERLKDREELSRESYDGQTYVAVKDTRSVHLDNGVSGMVFVIERYRLQTK